MKSLQLTALLFLTISSTHGQESATVVGTVTSLDGSHLPKAHISLEPYLDNLMMQSRLVEADANGDFAIRVSKAGLYRVVVQGVLHKTMRFPLWIRKPDTVEVSIRLDPKNLDDGSYFDSREYLSWIRVTGDFNAYNFDQGIRFRKEDRTTLTAYIPTAMDTIRYQIVGITSGTTVLPGADDYELRDRDNYQAVVAVKGDTVSLRYKADSTYFDNQNPYEGYRHTFDPDQSEYQFISQQEQAIHKNLERTDYFSEVFNYQIVKSNSLTVDEMDAYVSKIYSRQNRLRLSALSQTEKKIRQSIPDGPRPYLQSLYINYLITIKELLAPSLYPTSSASSKDLEQRIDDEILKSSLESLPPYSPLWLLRNSELPALYPELLGFTPEVVSYLEEIAQNHPSEQLAGSILLRLFKWAHSEFGTSETTRGYYQKIIDRFGDDYYARKAREHAGK